jgi:predicted TIM-barrel fold metal-dependent hydrolase
MQANLISLIAEGVFDRFPGMRVVSAENGFGWAPSLMWRMDYLWEKLRDDVPHLSKPPSEYVREHVWFTTQPMEEPPKPRQFLQLLDQLQMNDRLMFATDYPHWDNDMPGATLRFLPTETRRRIFSENPRRALRLA